MLRRTAQILGIAVGLLAIMGLFVEGQHLFGFINVDPALDIIRIPVAAALLYAGFGTDNARTLHAVLAAVGILYVGMGVIGLFDRTLAGLAPNGLTAFDIVFHLVSGAWATWLGFAHHEAGTYHAGMPHRY